jgi:hypothetical protein
MPSNTVRMPCCSKLATMEVNRAKPGPELHQLRDPLARRT